MNKKLRLLQHKDKPYGEIIIVFTGYYYQLLPINGKPIYSEYHHLWHSLVNKDVKLQKNHRFENDLEFGESLDRYRKNEWTEEDNKKINSRMIDDSIGVMPPKDDDIYVFYCKFNKQRTEYNYNYNFSNHVGKIHPLVRQGDRDYSVCNSIPMHTTILESLI